jgi:cell pole-organizing protein PopZ
MAEKNTHSILETIKKKMLKLDQKADKPAEVSSANNSSSEDEFEDISSSGKKEQKAEKLKPEVVQAVDQKFEDDLGLDIEKSEEEKDVEVKKSPEKAAGSESFKDFNLDDLDLDNEEKIFAEPKQINPAKKDLAANIFPDPTLDASEIDKSEDEVEVEDSETVSSVSSSGDVGPVDWLGNPVNSSAVEQQQEEAEEDEEEYQEETEDDDEEDHQEDDLDLEHNENNTEEEDKNLDEEDEEGFQEYEEDSEEDHEDLESDEKREEDDLDLEYLDEDHEQEQDLLDEEELAESVSSPQKELPSFDAHLMGHDAETSIKQQNTAFAQSDLSKKQNEEVLDDVEFLEKSEPEKKKEDFDFTDLEQEEDDIFAEIKNDEMEQESAPKNISEEIDDVDPLDFKTPQQEVIEDEKVGDFVQPQIEKHEIDLEFEKELMGFASNASDSFNQKPAMPESKQSMTNITPMKNESLPEFEEEKSPAKPAEFKNYEATVRQVNDSVRKLVDAKNVVSGISSFSQSPALAELALHLMEPKIEKWFNDNLPELVEKVVREEIKKMIPRE